MKLLIRIILAIIISFAAHEIIIAILSEVNVDSDPTKREIIYLGIYFKLLTFFFCLICLPYILKRILNKFNPSQNLWWLPILLLFPLGLALSHLWTPNDLISTLIAFIFWFPIIIVNYFYLKINKSKT